MKKILILDIETTDFSPRTGHICEIGIVSLDLDSGEIETLFDSVCHQKGMTAEEVSKAWIIRNSTLTVEEIRQAPDLEELRPKIQEILNAYPLGCTAYNNAFDFQFLDFNGFFFPKKLDCPMKLSTDICKIPKGMGSYKWPKVQEAFDHFFGKTDYIEQHRGADDAKHEAKIVFELYKMGVFHV